MNRMIMLARLMLQSRVMADVMNNAFIILDSNEFKLKTFIEHEAFAVLKQWKTEVDDAISQGMSTKEFAAFLIFDAIKIEILSGDHHVYRGVLSVNGKTLVEEAGKMIKIMISMGIVEPDKAPLLVKDIKEAIKNSG